MTQVALSADFLTAFSHIPQAQQKKVREFVTRFQANPASPAIHLEPLHDMRDSRVRTVRIDLAYRAIVLHPEQGDVFILMWVDHHDEAMAWARRKTFDVNETTGALQIYDTVEGPAVAATPVPAGAKPLDEYGPYETFSDADLLRTGLPRVLLPSIRALRKADELEDLRPHVPEEAYEALFWIGQLGCSVDRALGEVAAGRPAQKVDVADVEAALEHPDSRRRFVVVRSADELEQMLDAPLARWRVFLHPSQASLVRRHFSGPARVLGGAGTGKTVVAIHRARYLAAEVFTGPADRILFTTFTRNLADNIRANLRQLGGPEFERIEVVHLHRWAVDYLRDHGAQIEIASESEIRAAWQTAIGAAKPGSWPVAFYRQEWERVVQAQALGGREDYLRASRVGQMIRLTRQQRAEIWDVLAAYQAAMTSRGKLEWVDVIREARQKLEKQGGGLPYRAIVVDETQDLHAEELRLLRQIVPPGPNDLFLVGDAHQRIYGRPVVLSQCSINVRGRSSKLRINYRTTDEIRNWAVGLLEDQSIDDLDGERDSQQDYTSLLHGPAPAIRHFTTMIDEQAFLVQAIRALLQSAPAASICLVARTNAQLADDYAPALVRAGIARVHLQSDEPGEGTPGVRLATMHRVKGLEFAHVLIAGVNDGIVPLDLTRSTVDDAESADTELRERSLLHVAATRARDTLTITSYGVPGQLVQFPE